MEVAQARQGTAQADSAKDQFGRVHDDAIRQIVLADNALNTNLTTRAAVQSLMGVAEITFDALLSAYRSGVGSITGFTILESHLLQANNASSDSYNAVFSALATFALATGILGAAPQ